MTHLLASVPVTLYPALEEAGGRRNVDILTLIVNIITMWKKWNFSLYPEGKCHCGQCPNSHLCSGADHHQQKLGFNYRDLILIYLGHFKSFCNMLEAGAGRSSEEIIPQVQLTWEHFNIWIDLILCMDAAVPFLEDFV